MQNVKTQLLRRRGSLQPSALHSSPLLLEIVIVFLVILIFPDMVMVLPVNMLIILLLHTLMVLLGFAKDFGVYGCRFHTKNIWQLCFLQKQTHYYFLIPVAKSKRQEVFAFLSPRSDILMRI